MKKVFLLLLFFLVFDVVICSAQPCNLFSLGEFFDELKGLKVTPQKLNFRRYSDFDFVSFKPVNGGTSDSLNYVDVGYDDKGNLKELIFRKLNETYALSIYDCKEHRILLVKRQDAFKEWLYTPTAIFNSKCGNYMISVVPQFGKDYNPYELFKYFPITTFEKISCLMNLRQDLYPVDFVKLSNSRIVVYSGLKYEFERSPRLELEALHFFIGSEYKYTDLNIEKKMGMKEIMDRAIILGTESNMIVPAKPDIFKELDAPLWIFSGAHSYSVELNK